MKKIIATLAVCCLSLMPKAAGQGYLVFANSSASLITTNNGAGATGNITTTPNSFFFEIYVGPAGVSENQLTNVAFLLTSNSTLQPGRLRPQTLAVPGTNPGDTITTQVYGWSANLGNTWGEARQNAVNGTYTGVGLWTDPAVPRPLGSYVLGATLPPSYSVMRGTNPDPPPNVLIPGFELTPVPEPSILAVGFLGSAGLFFLRRRRAARAARSVEDSYWFRTQM